jgi:mannosyltransferase
VQSQTLSPERATGVRPAARKPAGAFDPVAVAVLTIAISLAGASRPSLWFDEAATISAAKNRSLPELWQMLGNIDAVHGVYYLLMHGWFAIAPATEFWSRVPSALAVGVAAAGIVVLARQFSARSVAVCAGVVFAILPRTTWAGIEARSYAFTVVAAVWLTILVVAAVRRPRPSRWLLYAVVLLSVILLNMFLVLLVPVYGALLAVLSARRSAVVWWAVTSTAVVSGVIPFMLFAHGQIRQVAWIFPIGTRTFRDVAVQQYFDKSVPFAIGAGVVIAAALVVAWAHPNPCPDAGTGTLLLITLAWIGIPTAVLIVYSALCEPLYYPRYLCFTAPAMAVLLGICIVAVARNPLPIAGVLVAVAASAVPNYLFSQRGAYAKEGMDFSQVADILTYHAVPGDCLLLDNTTAWAPGPVRPITAARPAAYGKLKDVGRGMPAADRHTLWDGQIPVWAVADRIRQCGLIWTVTDRDKTLPDHASGTALSAGPRMARAPAYQVQAKFGFHIVERWQFSFAQITKSTRYSDLAGDGGDGDACARGTRLRTGHTRPG